MQFATQSRIRTTRATGAHQGAHFLTRPAVLWTLQGVLAALFFFAGGFKLVAPISDLEEQSPFAGEFLKFIGACEFLGAIGLVLPGLLRIRTALTPLAAAGLVIIMIGATVATIVDMGVAPALMPFAVGVVAGWVAYTRWQLVPLRGKSTSPAARAQASLA